MIQDRKLTLNRELLLQEWRKGLSKEDPDEKVSRGRVPNRLAIPNISYKNGFVKLFSGEIHYKMMGIDSSSYILSEDMFRGKMSREIFSPKPLTFLES